jgi:hypothetical protein
MLKPTFRDFYSMGAGGLHAVITKVRIINSEITAANRFFFILPPHCLIKENALYQID